MIKSKCKLKSITQNGLDLRRHHRGVQFGSNNGQGLGHVEADVGHHITGHVQN
jgi:hypothetical protein